MAGYMPCMDKTSCTGAVQACHEITPQPFQLRQTLAGAACRGTTGPVAVDTPILSEALCAVAAYAAPVQLSGILLHLRPEA